MALSANVKQFGQPYEFGFPPDAAATIDPTGNFIARGAELRYEAEVFAQAQDGEGHTDSIVTSVGSMRKITATFTGYILAYFNPDNFLPEFDFSGRHFITRNVSVPRRKGEFAEVSLEAESYGLITGGP